jgi:hypothetical protein
VTEAGRVASVAVVVQVDAALFEEAHRAFEAALFFRNRARCLEIFGVRFFDDDDLISDDRSSDDCFIGVEIIAEPLGGAHRDPAGTAERIKDSLIRILDQLGAMSTDDLVQRRYAKFRAIGRFVEPSTKEPGETAEG